MAEKSSQIWSDVASQKSQVQQQFGGQGYDEQIHHEADATLMEQNRRLAQEMH